MFDSKMSVENTRNGLTLTLKKLNNYEVLTTNKFLEANVQKNGNFGTAKAMADHHNVLLLIILILILHLKALRTEL
jgi:hypothetical protein